MDESSISAVMLVGISNLKRGRVAVIRLTQLCDRLGRGLQRVGSVPVAAVELSGVHISELDDPTPYLEGGELLLTTGIPFGHRTNVVAYVDRLRARGVAALGVGLGAGTDVVPADLDRACAAAGLPLFVVPDSTPFMQVSRAYWDLVGKTAQADLAASLTVQTSLAHAATRPEAVVELVKVLATALGGWAVYLPADGTAETCWPRRSRHVLPLLREETKRLDLGGTRTAASFAMAGADVLEYSIIDGTRTAGFLAVCADRTLRAPDRQLIVTGSMLLAVTAQREWQLARANSIVGATAATLVLNGFVDAARLVVADFAQSALPERVQLLAIRGENVESLSQGELADHVAALVGFAVRERLRAGIRGSRLRCTADGVSYVILETPIALDAVDRSPHSSIRIAAAAGNPVLLRELHSSVAELRRACLGASLGQLSMGESVFDERAAGWAEALAGYSRADLISTATSYLRHQGQWEAAARELGVHRNSLRHRMGIVTSLIGADIDDPDVSAHLWLALRAR
jgi:PucR family transcriptional regulator, purine catabolism regulatory protein